MLTLRRILAARAIESASEDILQVCLNILATRQAYELD